MQIVIIDYGSGNLRSVAKAFEKVLAGRDGHVKVSNSALSLKHADRIVLPGVGAFADCMQGLQAISGMQEALHDAVIERQIPFLGVCVGMQMMVERSFEHGEHAGLGWIAGQVRRMESATPRHKIPHMGWNELYLNAEHPMLNGIQNGDHAYFVHSYAVHCEQAGHVLAEAQYGSRFAAIIGRDNLIGSQFHPEKSQQTGLRFLSNFLEWHP